MAELMLNGRLATDFEAAAIEHGRACELARDAEVVAGLTGAGPVPRHEGRPVTDLVLEFSGPGKHGRRRDDRP